MIIRRLVDRLGLLALLLTACSTASEGTLTPLPEATNGSAETSSSAESSSLPGLYLTEDVILTEDEGSFRVGALMPCENLIAMLSSGEWRQIGQTSFPSMAGEIHWLLLERAEQRLFGKASGSTIFPDVSEDNAGEGIEGQPTAIPFETCSAELIPVTRQSITASGTFEAEGQAYLMPNACAEVDGQADLSLMYEGPGQTKVWLQTRTPLTLGEHQLDFGMMENFQLNAFQSDLSLFDFFGFFFQMQAGGESEIPAEAEQVQAFNFFPSPDTFTGTVRIDNLEPFQGSFELHGLVEGDSGAAQDIQLSFECPLQRATQAEYAGAEGPQINEVPLTITLKYNYDFSFGGTSLTNVGHVTLEGSLLHSAANKYGGSFIANGEGSYSTYDINGEVCANSWRGTQTIEVLGTAYGSQMELKFNPSGFATVDFETDCKSGNYQEGSLPHDNGTLYGQGMPLTLKWPPGSPENDSQTIDNSIEGWTEIWQVEFGTAK